ncbi:MAG TPA: tetratricopeptide repeat protein [Rhizomicrobium sp.]|nr:tetratricopeptide repeat protein [Rhizomicrobium sp.]
MVATSILPKMVRRDFDYSIDDGYQTMCIQSWIENGFRVLSVNDGEEIPELTARYPDVTFIAASRNASSWTGRKTPYIADLLLALKDAPEPVLGIINGDLLFEPSAAWVKNLPAAVSDAMVVAHRYDTYSLRHGSLRRFFGLDCFFFDRDTACLALEDAMPFAMGVPWWDYWLPCLALLSNRKLLLVDRPAILHLIHTTGYSPDVARNFTYIFANSVINKSKRSSPAMPQIALKMISLCHKIAVSPAETESGQLTQLSDPVVKLLDSTLRQSRVDWKSTDDAPHPQDSPFARVKQRFAAGRALDNARRLLLEDRLRDIAPPRIAAMHQVPEDARVQAMLGEIALNRGDLKSASAHFIKVAKLWSEVRPLQLAGNLLRAMGNREEALDCFRSILQFEPGLPAIYIAIAQILSETHRQGDAVDFLEKAMMQNPNLPGVKELHETYRKQAQTPTRTHIKRVIRRMQISRLGQLIRGLGTIGKC